MGQEATNSVVHEAAKTSSQEQSYNQVFGKTDDEHEAVNASSQEQSLSDEEAESSKGKQEDDDIDSDYVSRASGDSAQQFEVEAATHTRRCGKGEGSVGSTKKAKKEKEEKQAHLEALLDQGIAGEEAFATAFGRCLLIGAVGNKLVGKMKEKG